MTQDLMVTMSVDEQLEILGAQFDNGELDEQYADYIMDNCVGDRVICNGDTLTEAMEDHYLLDSFLESLLVV